MKRNRQNHIANNKWGQVKIVTQKKYIRKRLCKEHPDFGLNLSMFFILYTLYKLFIPKEKRKKKRIMQIEGDNYQSTWKVCEAHLK